MPTVTVKLMLHTALPAVTVTLEERKLVIT